MQPSNDAYESLCRRCGQSCHFAVPVNGLAVVVDDLHCRYLKQISAGKFSCSVYSKRLEVAPWCHTAADALEEGFLAQDCPYAADKPGYKGKIRLSAHLMKKVTPAIRKEILTHGVPVGVSLEGVSRFLERTGGGEWEYELTLQGDRFIVRPKI